MEIQQSIDLIRRGTERIIDEQELAAKLEKSINENKPLIIKLGVDPTAPDIHLGHTVPFRKLKHFQDLGHEVCFLIGDFTGRIGDPSGRDKTRPPLTEEDILQNAQTYLNQVSKILDASRLRVVYNSHWLKDLNFGELIKMAAQVTMSKLLEHNTFKQRMEESETIRMHEFLYPFMQGFDSVALKADVELGGSDQTFNLTFGRDLQKQYGQEPQVCITLPILCGTDGVKKMSKSLGNYIGINEPPGMMMDKLMRMTDANIISYFTLLTDVPLEEITEMELRMKNTPDTDHILSCKKKLAFNIIAMYHGMDAAQICVDSYGNIEKLGITELSLAAFADQHLSEIMVGVMGVESKTQARRLFKQGAVRVNGKKIDDEILLSVLQPGDIVNIGKLKSFKLMP